jgi:hypothetical protein
MDQSPKALAGRLSILRYFEIIKTETDSLRHKILAGSPAEETAQSGKGRAEQ